MSQFLRRDKQAILRVALQDAVITMKHALELEKFNMKYSQLGVPLTLFSIGINYVFNQ